MVQWLRLSTSTAEGMGLIPGQGTIISHVTWHGQKNKMEFLFLKYTHTHPLVFCSLSVDTEHLIF